MMPMTGYTLEQGWLEAGYTVTSIGGDKLDVPYTTPHEGLYWFQVNLKTKEVKVVPQQDDAVTLLGDVVR